MAMQTEEQSMPQDITIQIFSWLPVKSLMRFRCLSKFYNSIVVEPNFVDLHLSHYSTINCGDTKLIVCITDGRYAIEDHDEDRNANKYHQIENFNKLYDHINGRLDYHSNCESDNGLFCIWDVKYIAICNPSTSEVRFLPYLQYFDIEQFICSIGFEPRENKYKVLLTMDVYEEGLSRAWIFTLGIDESWREIIKYGENGYYVAPYRSGVCISGIIYRFNHAPEYCIIAFDVKSEIFSNISMSIELHHSLHGSLYDYILIEVKGKLGILNFLNFWSDQDIHLWVLGEDEEWEHHENFRFPIGWKDIDLSSYMTCKYRDDEIVFAVFRTISSNLDCFFYDIKKKNWRHFLVQGLPERGEGPDRIECIFTYRESLFPLKNIGTVHPQVFG